MNADKCTGLRVATAYYKMFHRPWALSMKEWVAHKVGPRVRRNWSGRLFQSPGPMPTEPQDPHHPGHLGKIKTSYILMNAAGRITKCVPPSICGISCNTKLNNNQNQILFCLWFHHIQLYKYGATEGADVLWLHNAKHWRGLASKWIINRDTFNEGKVYWARLLIIKANTLDKWCALDALLSSALISCQQLCRPTRSWAVCDITPYSAPCYTSLEESTLHNWTDGLT